MMMKVMVTMMMIMSKRETTIDNTCREECQATACDAQCELYKLKQTQRKLCSVSLDALGSATLSSKTSLDALGPNTEEKQVMLQLTVTVRSFRGSLCYGAVRGQVALTCSKSVCRTLDTQDSRTLVAGHCFAMSMCSHSVGRDCLGPSFKEFTALRTRTLFNSECHWRS